MEPPLGNVIITSREIYDAVVRLTGRVDVLIEQHNNLSRDQQEHERAAETSHQDHEIRIRSLERGRWPLPSLAVLISAGALVLAVFPR